MVFHSLQSDFQAHVDAQFALQPAPTSPATLVTESDLAHLPAPVAAYLRRSSAVGRPRVHNFRVAFDATMYQKPDHPMASAAVQYSFIAHPARCFYLTTRMMGLPVSVLHVYANEHARMQVRAAGLVNVQDHDGGPLNRAETVTLLNDLCIMAPAALIDPRLTWTAIDERSAGVRFTNGAQSVTATLVFDANGDLVDFSSDDRHALENDGTRWSTPLRNHRDFDGHRLAGEGDAIWHYPDRAFTYGHFVMKEIVYNVAGPEW